MRHKLAAGLGLALVLALGITPAWAGTADGPEITDPAGDANFVSPPTGIEEDTRPVSLDNADLRAVWFETAHEVIDGEPRATALLIHIETEGPVRSGPLADRAFRYRVSATLPACQVVFEFVAQPDPANDRATMWATTACPGMNPGSGLPSPVTPSVAGTVATVEFPLNFQQLPQIIPLGATISEPAAQTELVVPFVRAVVDDTAVGRSFTVGQDLPDAD